jgi:hypothetical protein
MCQGEGGGDWQLARQGGEGLCVGLWEYGLGGIAFYKPPRGKGLPLKKSEGKKKNMRTPFHLLFTHMPFSCSSDIPWIF